MLTQDNFEACFNFVLAREGGFVDDPRDAGGATNMGVTQRTLSNFLGRSATIDEVKNLSVQVAAQIYKKNYYDACGCGDMPAPLALVVFDAAVNAGNMRSVMFLQEAMSLPADGRFGAQTAAAIAHCDVAQTVAASCAWRLDFYQKLPAWGTYGHGWGNRIELVKETALSWISST